ncbi:MAG: hypothetical protein ABIJ09_00835 [Pseudomonadota bacterium]
MRRMLVSLTALCLVVLSSACATTTTIKTDPPGGVVFDENGNQLGATPYEYTSKTWKTDQDKLVIKKSGFKDQVLLLERSDVAVGPLVGAIAMICCGVPFLSTVVIGGGLIAGGIVVILAGGFNYPAETVVVMKPAADASPDPAPLVPPAIKEDEVPLSLLF